MNPVVGTLRRIVQELRVAVPEQNFRELLGKRYIFEQFRKYKVTDQQLCKAQEEVKFLANTYLCYLRSLRRCQEIHKEYHGKGERTVDETAKLVGFKLPHDPK